MLSEIYFPLCWLQTVQWAKIEKNYRYIKKKFFKTAVAHDCFAHVIHYKYGYMAFCYFIFNSLTKAITGTQKHNASELGML